MRLRCLYMLAESKIFLHLKAYHYCTTYRFQCQHPQSPGKAGIAIAKPVAMGTLGVSFPKILLCPENFVLNIY